MLDRESAATFAVCFKALGDATRVQLVSLLSDAGKPMTVGELAQAVGITQPTVSHHLKILQSIGFVLSTPVGTSSLYRLNHRCVACFPTAGDVAMGRRASVLAMSTEPERG